MTRSKHSSYLSRSLYSDILNYMYVCYNGKMILSDAHSLVSEKEVKELSNYIVVFQFEIRKSSEI